MVLWQEATRPARAHFPGNARDIVYEVTHTMAGSHLQVGRATVGTRAAEGHLGRPDRGVGTDILQAQI